MLVEPAMSPPLERAGHWTLRAPAKKTGVAVSTAFGILKRKGLKLRKIKKKFKASLDPKFELKVREVVGPCADPPDHAETRTPRLQAQRRRLPDCGPCRCRRKGRRSDGRAPPLGGVHRHSGPRRGGDRARNPGSRCSRQRRLPQVGRGRRTAEGPPRLDVPLHPGPGLLNGCRRGLFLQAVEAEAE